MSEYVTDLLHTRRIKKRLPGKTNLDILLSGDAGVSEIFKWLDFKSIETRRRYGMYKIGLGQSSSPEDSSEDFPTVVKSYTCADDKYPILPLKILKSTKRKEHS